MSFIFRLALTVVMATGLTPTVMAQQTTDENSYELILEEVIVTATLIES